MWWVDCANTLFLLVGSAGLAVNLSICRALLQPGLSMFDKATLLLCAIYCAAWPVRQSPAQCQEICLIYQNSASCNSQLHWL